MAASNRLANSTALGRQAGRLTGVGSSTRAAITITDSRAKLILRRVKVHHVSGSANHFHAAIYRAVGALPNSIEQELYGDKTNSLDLFDVVVEIPCQTDDDGKLWLAPGMNMGTNNVADYEIFWELAR
jgi:hypothetical protein